MIGRVDSEIIGLTGIVDKTNEYINKKQKQNTLPAGLLSAVGRAKQDSEAGGVTVMELDLRLKGGRFNPRPFGFQLTTNVHTHTRTRLTALFLGLPG